MAYHTGIQAAKKQYPDLDYAAMQVSFVAGSFDGVVGSTHNPQVMGTHWLFVREQVARAKAQAAVDAAQDADT